MNALVASYRSLDHPTRRGCMPSRCDCGGYGFIEQGYAKLARGPESFVNILHAIGFRNPSLLAGLRFW